MAAPNRTAPAGRDRASDPGEMNGTGCARHRSGPRHRRRHRAALAAEGWSVLAVDRAEDDAAIPYRLATKADLDAVVSRRQPRPAGQADGIGSFVADVRDVAALEAAVADAEDRWGGLDAAIGCAGRHRRRRTAVGRPAGPGAGRARHRPRWRAEPRPGRRCLRCCAGRSRAAAGSWRSRRPPRPADCRCSPPTARPRPGSRGLIRALAVELGPTRA